MHNYWVVGATWGGQKDQSEVFIRRGYWFMGWADEEQPSQASLRDEIREGDRIAIKRMLGQGSKEIEIRALGVVKEVDSKDKRVYVHWAAKDLNRRVAAKGCFASIHGPFNADDQWTRQVFQL
ncbi:MULTISPECIES: hypothetical protein [unclassified Caballeronia]|uniref:hypothetical protein n=1 Tax=unclassified Caballeronia TaxID=2646786 RepID=UPI0020299923|nr:MULTISPECIES: hypothetical protein [unclassified Caballeronia]